MGHFALILGGARSGKSDYAQRLAESRPGPVRFVATAQAADDEMKARIAAHRQRRPARWQTIELPRGVGRYMLEHSQPSGVVLLDCVTLLISNCMLDNGHAVEPDQAAAHAAVHDEIESLLHAIRQSGCEWIVVSNEVGQGIVPAYATGRMYRDLLGWANKELARQADEVIWMVAGIPVPVGQYRAEAATAESAANEVDDRHDNTNRDDDPAQ
jgi:adenosylcobinamide kinase/adenosylcobinamide-phosphate guanylyltransferase